MEAREGGETEVSNLNDIFCLFDLVYQDVVKLDVSMNDLVFVDEIHCKEELLHDKLDLSFIHLAILLHTGH